MAELEKEKLNKLKKGELLGNIATAFCGAVLVFFIVCFSIAQAKSLETLRLVTVIISPILIALGAGLSAYCNIKFGGAIDRLINGYITDTMVENAALLHPERNSLSFFIELQSDKVYLKVNGYKECVIFDFSAFKKLSLSRKLSIVNAVENRLICTFCRLYERGAEYSSVSFAERASSKRKSGKTFYIIENGSPDTKSFKTYLKLK